MTPREIAAKLNKPVCKCWQHGEKVADGFMEDAAIVAGQSAGYAAYRNGLKPVQSAPPEWADIGWLVVAWERAYFAAYYEAMKEALRK
jgi:hypothetical protein